MRLPDKMTIGEAYGPAVSIQTEEEAAEYFAALVDRNMRVIGNSEEEAQRIEGGNLGYYAGYYDRETAERVMRLFDVSHPIFGKPRPTPEEAFDAGVKMAKETP